MAQVINTNALSLMAQNNLNKSQAQLGTAIQRLSSGLRINSAKDDAAGQAITGRFTANIEGMTQAARNANDGISLAQNTEGALNEIYDNVLNIRRLTSQALNGTNSESDKKSIQEEIDARLSEIGRIAKETEFNGVNVLDGSTSQLKIQIGAKDGQTIDIDLPSMDLEKLGLDGFSITNAIGKGFEGPTLTGPGQEVAAGATVDFGGTTAVMNDANMSFIATNVFGTGKTAADLSLYTSTDEDGATHIYAIDATDGGEAVEITGITATGGAIDGVNTGDKLSKVDTDVLQNGLSKIKSSDQFTVGQSFTVKTTGGDDIKLTLDAAMLDDIAAEVNMNVEDMSLYGVNNNGTMEYYAIDKDGNGMQVPLTYDGNNLAVGTATAAGAADIAAIVNNSNDKLTKLDDALAQVDSFRSGLGAVQNRFGSIISNLNTTINNMTEARSRILDADFSSEVSAMSRANILQQAGVTVLGQANQVPQNVLSLLR